MKMKKVVGFCAAAIAFAGFVQAQDLRRVTFIGTLNDYSPSTVSGGPWEMRGEWSLDLLGTANFSADFSMETSDYGITDSTQVDPANPATRSPHTHHIVMNNATVSYDTSACPANKPASTGAGVMITGTAITSAMEARRPSRAWDRQPCRSVSLEGPRSNTRTLRWCTPDLQPVISERKRSMASSERLPPSRKRRRPFIMEIPVSCVHHSPGRR